MADIYFEIQEIQRARENPKPRANRVAPRAPTKPKEDRDPKGINKHVECGFYNVLAEPKTAPQSVDCIWEFSELVFDCCRDCWYKLFSLFCGCCIAIAWAIEYAPIAASHVWCLTPFTQMVKLIVDGCLKPFWYLCIGLCVVPCTQSCAYFFHNCAYGKVTRPPTPQLFPDRPKKKPPPKPTKKKEEPVKQKKKEAVVPVPVVAAAPAKKYNLEDPDKEKLVASVRRQLMLV